MVMQVYKGRKIGFRRVSEGFEGFRVLVRNVSDSFGFRTEAFEFRAEHCPHSQLSDIIPRHVPRLRKAPATPHTLKHRARAGTRSLRSRVLARAAHPPRVSGAPRRGPYPSRCQSAARWTKAHARLPGGVHAEAPPPPRKVRADAAPMAQPATAKRLRVLLPKFYER